VVELIGVDGLDEAELIHDLCQVRHHFRNLSAALAVLREFESRAEHGRVGADEGVALAHDDRGRNGLAFELGQLGLVVEEVELGRRAGHEQVDDALGLGRKMGRLDRHEVRRHGAARGCA
jgi:hypothetical protein